MSKRNPRIVRGRLISAHELMKYDAAAMCAIMDEALEEQQEIARCYTQVVERMNHLLENSDDMLSFMSAGASAGFAGFEEFALSSLK